MNRNQSVCLRAICFFIFTIQLLFIQQLKAQSCDLTLNVRIKQNGKSDFAISLLGPEVKRNVLHPQSASFGKLCSGTYKLKVQGINFESFDTTIVLSNNLEISLLMNESVHQLHEFEVHDNHIDRTGNSTLSSSTLNNAQLQVNAGKPLGELLKEASGVSTLQSGPTISKPIIHGLHSNRVLIIQNGIRLEGQQWGTEHAPEIDPFTVAQAEVLKGAASLRYGSDAIGGVVLLEPSEISAEHGTRGMVRLAGISNGRMGLSSARLDHSFGGKLCGMGIRIQGTLKDAGNIHTPSYYLKNTGMREQNFSSTWMLNRKRLALEVSGSVFNSKIGIFTGSHVGSLSELQQALVSTEPKDSAGFSRQIERGFQQIKHEMLKARFCYHFLEDEQVEIIYGLQRNHRKEYDSDIPFSSDPSILNAPQADFLISTHTADLVYSRQLKNQVQLSVGSSLITQGNVFKGLEYRALIPNYRNYGVGSFAALLRTWKKWKFETGLRYDYRWLTVYRLNYSTLKTFATSQTYQNWSYSAGLSFRVSEQWSITANLGSAWRAPNVNELYGKGVHQSAASFEIGDSTLKSERALNFSISNVWESERFRFELGIYRNAINNFIYLKPLLNPVLTISGAYPSFAQTQVNALFSGIDADYRFTLFKGLKIGGKMSLIKGFNQTIKDYLVFTPANRAEIYTQLEGNSNERGVKPYLKISFMGVAKQNYVPVNSDYTAPPNAYSLFNFDAGLSIGKKHPVDLGFSIYNILNTSYRDYLNRFRYFSDEQGRSFAIRINVPFNF